MKICCFVYFQRKEKERRKRRKQKLEKGRKKRKKGMVDIKQNAVHVSYRDTNFYHKTDQDCNQKMSVIVLL